MMRILSPIFAILSLDVKFSEHFINILVGVIKVTNADGARVHRAVAFGVVQADGGDGATIHSEDADGLDGVFLELDTHNFEFIVSGDRIELSTLLFPERTETENLDFPISNLLDGCIHIVGVLVETDVCVHDLSGG